ncbi:MAG: hypothetical protein ACYTG1_04295 [Planctomycetota bacterium]|jgi:hypothetical protein
MTSPTYLNREELIELAALDALGLLEEFESQQYNRSFHHAPAAVQAEVRQIQADFASDECFLPELEPPEELRRRVLEAVSKAIEGEQVHLAPIARIGRPRTGGATAGRLGPSGQFWRAAAFVLAAGTIVCLYFLSQIYGNSQEITRIVLAGQTDARLQELLGPGFEEIANHPKTVAANLLPVDGDFDGMARVYLNEKTDQLFLLTMHLPDTGQYTLQTRTEDGAVRQIASLEGGGVLGTGLRLDGIGASALMSVTWELTDHMGTVVLTSAT